MKLGTQIRTLFLIKQNHSLYPPIGGAALRNWQNVNVMIKFGSVAVFLLIHDNKQNEDKPTNIAIWNVNDIKERKMSFREKLNQIAKQIKSLLIKGHPFTSLGSIYSPEIVEELKCILDEFKPDIVVFSQHYLSVYLPIIKDYPCRIVLDAHNAETHLLHETHRQKPSKGLKNQLMDKIELFKTKVLESELVRNSDQVWTCSEQDIAMLQKLSPNKPIQACVVPNTVDSEFYSDIRADKCTLPDEIRKSPWTLLFPATFDYIPNTQAANFLVDDIYPQIKEMYPECQLLLVGSGATQYMLDSAKRDPSIIVTGRVADIRPYFAAASIVIVPLLNGSGTRLKIIEAFASERPVVSTSKGVEGINAFHNEHLLIGDTTEQLVANVHKIWSDQELTKCIIKSAYDLFDRSYSWESVSKKVGQAIENLGQSS